MTGAYYALGVLIFVVAILASIGLHEFGHLIPAKRFGGKVTQWFVGFGPTVWSRRIGETEYGLKAIPLGGFVKIVGMLPPAKDADVVDADGGEQVRGSSTGMFTQLISDARAAEWEHVGPDDAGRLFYKMPWWKKVIVMAGGPTVNLLIAFALFWGVFATFGYVKDVKVEPVVDEVLPCIVPAAEDGRVCSAEELRDNPTPASQAGLQPGDRIVAFDGTAVTGWQQVQGKIRESGDRAVTLGVERDGTTREVQVTPVVTPRPTDEDDPGKLEPVGFLGVAPVVEPLYATGGPLVTLEYMGSATVRVVEGIGQLPVAVWNVAKALAGLQERDPEGPVSIVGGGRLAGEVAATDQFDVQEKLATLLMIIAGFNLFIGMFNFVPLLPLDGGHIAGALWEGIRRGFARLTRRPDPGHVDVAKLLPVAYVAASAMLVMGLVLIAADIFIPVQIDF